jgi:dynein heavy chain
MDFVLFDHAMNHFVRIARVIGMPRVHAMRVGLVGVGGVGGVGGSGKQSLTRLASTILSYQIFQVVPGRNYSTDDFMADLRELYRRAGLLNKLTTFIFTDNEVKNESFLEYINNMLTTGEMTDHASSVPLRCTLIADTSTSGCSRPHPTRQPAVGHRNTLLHE